MNEDNIIQFRKLVDAVKAGPKVSIVDELDDIDRKDLALLLAVSKAFYENLKTVATRTGDMAMACNAAVIAVGVAAGRHCPPEQKQASLIALCDALTHASEHIHFKE